MIGTKEIVPEATEQSQVSASLADQVAEIDEIEQLRNLATLYSNRAARHDDAQAAARAIHYEAQAQAIADKYDMAWRAK